MTRDLSVQSSSFLFFPCCFYMDICSVIFAITHLLFHPFFEGHCIELPILNLYLNHVHWLSNTPSNLVIVMNFYVANFSVNLQQ